MSLHQQPCHPDVALQKVLVKDGPINQWTVSYSQETERRTLPSGQIWMGIRYNKYYKLKNILSDFVIK